MFYPVFYQRDLTGSQVVTPPVRLGVQNYSWSALGGPRECQLVAQGSPPSLWEMAELLRCPLEIYDERGERVWWGFVNQVETYIGQLQVTVSLDGMANRVAVAYVNVAAGETSGNRATTAYAQDSTSVDEYGTKEWLESTSISSTAEAAEYRDTVLARRRYPIAVWRPQARAGLQVTVTGVGWFDTLGWRYLDNAGTTLVETTTQISDIVTAVGEFFQGTVIEDASGISSSEYRNGDRTALAEVIMLLEKGSVNSQRMLAAVTPDRYLRVYEEPVLGASDYLMFSDSSVRTPQGATVPVWDPLVGVWTRLVDVIPAHVDLTKLSLPDALFIEQWEYLVSQAQRRLEPRDLEAVWKLDRITPG